MKRLAIALALVATVAACTKQEAQKPAAAAPDTSHMMMSADTSKHMMAPDTSKKMGAPATTKAPATPMQKAPTKAPTKRP
jgi:hypothetical protein